MAKWLKQVTDLFTELENVLIDRDFEIHLDINPDERHGSNVAYGAAKGMIQGYCRSYAYL